MGKIEKRYNIALIFTLVGVFLCSNMAYGLRPPMQFNSLSEEGRDSLSLDSDEVEEILLGAFYPGVSKDVLQKVSRRGILQAGGKSFGYFYILEKEAKQEDVKDFFYRAGDIFVVDSNVADLVPEEVKKSEATLIYLDFHRDYGESDSKPYTGTAAYLFRHYTILMLINMQLFDFKGKVVVDASAGNGVLSIASILLGAEKVYVSDMTEHFKDLIRDNAETNSASDGLVFDGYFGKGFRELAEDRADRAKQGVDIVLMNAINFGIGFAGERELYDILSIFSCKNIILSGSSYTFLKKKFTHPVTESEVKTWLIEEVFRELGLNLLVATEDNVAHFGNNTHASFILEAEGIKESALLVSDVAVVDFRFGDIDIETLVQTRTIFGQDEFKIRNDLVPGSDLMERKIMGLLKISNIELRRLLSFVIYDLISNALDHQLIQKPISIEVSLLRDNRKEANDGEILKIEIEQNSSSPGARDRLKANKEGFDPTIGRYSRDRKNGRDFMRHGLGFEHIERLMETTDVSLIYEIGEEPDFPIKTKCYISLDRLKLEEGTGSALKSLGGRDLASMRTVEGEWGLASNNSFVSIISAIFKGKTLKVLDAGTGPSVAFPLKLKPFLYSNGIKAEIHAVGLDIRDRFLQKARSLGIIVKNGLSVQELKNLETEKNTYNIIFINAPAFTLEPEDLIDLLAEDGIVIIRFYTGEGQEDFIKKFFEKLKLNDSSLWHTQIIYGGMKDLPEGTHRLEAPIVAIRREASIVEPLQRLLNHLASRTDS